MGGILPDKPLCAYFQYAFHILPEQPYDPCDPDLDPPDTFIDYGCEDQPPDTTQITLGVSGIDPNDCTAPEDLTYEWRRSVNGGLFEPWQPDDGPEITITELYHGNWAVEVCAVDLADNRDPEPAECLFYIPPDSDPEGWARTWGGPSSECGYSTALDDSGNIYVTGCFMETADFDPGLGIEEYTSNGGQDIFLSKFNTHGDFQWARTWGGLGMYERGYGVAVDDSGNVYVTGDFSSTVDFDPGPGIEERSPASGDDVFLSKFNSNGEFQWVCTLNGGYKDFSYGIAVDDLGGIYITGHLNDAALTKFGTDGGLQWVRTWGEGGVGNAVAVDNSMYVYITGRFSDTVDFDPGPGIEEHTSNGQDDTFLSKFNTDGEFQWVRTWGMEDSDIGYAVVAYGSENVYAAGEYQNTVDFDPGPGVDEHTSNGGPDVFLSKFNSNGDFQWACTWGGDNEDCGQGIAVDGSENILVTGDFAHTVDFDPGPGVDERTANGWQDAFLSKLDSSGALQWARTWGGEGWTEGHGICIDDFNNIYFTGEFYYAVDFDPGPGIDEHTPVGGDDVFLVKLLSDGYW
jgi:hypothetical protein